MKLTRAHTYAAKLSKGTHTNLCAFLEQQRQLFDATLQERIEAYRKGGLSIKRYEQQKSLTEIREDSEYSKYDLKAQRTVLRRLDAAFQGFFRRVNVQLICEHRHEVMRDGRAPIGIDVGIKSRAALSDGTVVPGRSLDRAELKKRQRVLSRAEKDSKAGEKKRALLAREWQRVSERERCTS